MLDLKFIRDNTDLVREALEKRQDSAPIDEMLQLDSERRLKVTELEDLRRARKEVARERSIGEFNERGGDLGIVRKAELIDALARPAFIMGEGAVSSIISSQFGFHILKVEKKYPAGSIKTLEEVHDELKQRIYVTKERSVYYDLIYELRDRIEPYISVPKDSAGAGR